MPLFERGNFKSSSGLNLDWKIDCDHLTDDDWSCISEQARKILPSFRAVQAVPDGGIKIKNKLVEYSTHRKADPILIVDDVWTTGKSMKLLAKHLNGVYSGDYKWIGFVVFARSTPTENVKALFALNEKVK